MRVLPKLDDLCNELKKYKDKKVVLTFHTIGDRDAVGSAVALSEFFTNATVVTPDFITNNARRMLSYLNYSDKITLNFPEAPDLIIILDANNTPAIGRLAEKTRPFSVKDSFHRSSRDAQRNDVTRFIHV